MGLEKGSVEVMEIRQRPKYWKGRPVLVTGAAGFLGSWMCRTLADLGANVVGLIRDDVPSSYLNLTGTDKKIVIVRGELEDYFLLERVLNEYQIATCFHFGAQPLVTAADRFPLATLESNIRGTWNILEASRKMPHLKFIAVASSDKAYGIKAKLPYKEEDALQGVHIYDVSKTCTDLLAQSYIHSYNLPAAIARCGNFYGPGDLNFDRLIPGTIRSLVFDENPIIRSNGRYLRDYIYIADVVEAYLAMAESPDRSQGQAFNFGTAAPASVLDVVEQITSVSGKTHLKPKIENTAKNEIPEQYLDITKAKKVLGWEPQYKLSEALKITYGWYQEFLAPSTGPSVKRPAKVKTA